MTEQEILLFIATTSPTPELSDILAKLDFEHETYPNLEDKIVNQQIATKAEYRKAYARAKRNHEIFDKLGCVPMSPEELVFAVMDKNDWRIDASSKTPLSWLYPPQQPRRVSLSADDLISAVTDINRNLLREQFGKISLVDQVIHQMNFYDHQIRADILEKLEQTGVGFDWDALIANSFDTTDVSAEITIAVLKKFIWQVKRRLDGMSVTNHLMPVIYGSQGCGKSVFITKMLDQLGSLYAPTDFSRLSDNREANLFRNFALFLDEMNKADRADMDAVKGVITREEFSFRPMGTNATVTKDQFSSFIGASNKLLEQLINDPTGNRRFFQIDFNSRSGPDQHAYINTLDFTAMWCSVDHRAADPCADYSDEMRALQASHSNKSSVEEFADALEEGEGRYKVTINNIGGTEAFTQEPVTGETLYLAYRNWCTAMHRRVPLEKTGFLAELRRLSGQKPDFMFEPKRTNKFNGWKYTGPVSASTNVIRMVTK